MLHKIILGLNDEEKIVFMPFFEYMRTKFAKLSNSITYLLSYLVSVIYYLSTIYIPTSSIFLICDYSYLGIKCSITVV